MKRRFIIQLPNCTEMLVTTNNGWAGLVDFVKYFNSEYDENILIRPVSFIQCFKFLLGGRMIVKNTKED